MRHAGWLALTASLAVLGLGCSSHGPYAPDRPGNVLEDTATVVLLDSGLRSEVQVSGEQMAKQEDGRLEVRAKILNCTDDLLRVQIQTEFKDGTKFSYGDVTPWEHVLLERNSTFTYSSISLSDRAQYYTIRIKRPE